MEFFRTHVSISWPGEKRQMSQGMGCRCKRSRQASNVRTAGVSGWLCNKRYLRSALNSGPSLTTKTCRSYYGNGLIQIWHWHLIVMYLVTSIVGTSFDMNSGVSAQIWWLEHQLLIHCCKAENSTWEREEAEISLNTLYERCKDSQQPRCAPLWAYWPLSETQLLYCWPVAEGFAISAQETKVCALVAV